MLTRPTAKQPSPIQGAAKAGGTQNNAGAGQMADPRRGTLSFVTQKFFCFGAINNRRNIGSIPLCRHIGWVFYPSAQVVSGTRTPLISSPGMVPRGCYK